MWSQKKNSHVNVVSNDLVSIVMEPFGTNVAAV